MTEQKPISPAPKGDDGPPLSHKSDEEINKEAQRLQEEVNKRFRDALRKLRDQGTL